MSSCFGKSLSILLQLPFSSTTDLGIGSVSLSLRATGCGTPLHLALHPGGPNSWLSKHMIMGLHIAETDLLMCWCGNFSSGMNAESLVAYGRRPYKVTLPGHKFSNYSIIYHVNSTVADTTNTTSTTTTTIPTTMTATANTICIMIIVVIVVWL